MRSYGEVLNEPTPSHDFTCIRDNGGSSILRNLGRGCFSRVRGSLPSIDSSPERSRPFGCLDERLPAADPATGAAFSRGARGPRERYFSFALPSGPGLECCYRQCMGDALPLQGRATDLERHSNSRIGKTLSLIHIFRLKAPVGAESDEARGLFPLIAAQNLLHRRGQVVEPESMKDPTKPVKRQLVSLKKCLLRGVRIGPCLLYTSRCV